MILFENLLISFKLFLVVFLFILSRRLSFLLSLGFTEGLAPTFFSLFFLFSFALPFFLFSFWSEGKFLDNLDLDEVL